MSDLFKNPNHRAQIGYNGFDMNQRLRFSSTTGELLPVYYDLLQPGDKVTCQSEIKTRTMEIKSAAMVSINEHLEWFFVPMTQIYSAFGDFIYQIQDLKSSLFTPTSFNSSYLPYIPAANLKQWGIANPDMFGQRSRYRLLDCFIPYTYYLNSTTITNNLPVDDFPVPVCPIFFAAYQKIWMDFYRLSDRQPNDPSVYNLDKFYSSPTIGNNAGIADIFTMRYRPARKDFFTNVFTSPLFGRNDISASNNSAILDSVAQWLVSYQASGLGASFNTNNPAAAASNPATLETTVVTAGPSASQSATTQVLATDVNLIRNALSPTSIRTSFAVQKLLEITRRAGKHYDAQTLAHFGVDVPKGISGEVLYLGASHSVVNIGDVIATASGTATSLSGSATSVLGQVGGKGYGYDKGRQIKFEAPAHGILMCIYSADVERNYPNQGIDKLQTLVRRSDWFSPEYDNLGMEPLFNFNVDFDVSVPGDYFTVFGWQYRYSYLKCKRNVNRGALDQLGNLKFWTTNKMLNINPGTLSNAAYMRNFFVSPTELNDVMLVNFSDYAVSSQGQYIFYPSDPLIHEIYFDVKKASRMSTYGLESL